MSFTLEEKLKEVKREISYRQFVYPGSIARGKITKELAAKRIQIMQAIQSDYEEKLQEGPLFRHADGGSEAKL